MSWQQKTPLSRRQTPQELGEVRDQIKTKPPFVTKTSSSPSTPSSPLSSTTGSSSPTTPSFLSASSSNNKSKNNLKQNAEKSDSPRGTNSSSGSEANGKASNVKSMIAKLNNGEVGTESEKLTTNGPTTARRRSVSSSSAPSPTDLHKSLPSKLQKDLTVSTTKSLPNIKLEDEASSSSPVVITGRSNTITSANPRKSIFQFFRPSTGSPGNSNSDGDSNGNASSGSTPRPSSQPLDLASISFSELDGDEMDVMIGSRSIAQLKAILLSDTKFGYLTLDQFLEFGLRYGFNHNSFINIFTTTYKSFMTPKQVVPILQQVLKSVTKTSKDLSQAKQEKQNRILQRAANFINIWVTKCQTDFMFDKNIVENLFSFIGGLNNYTCQIEPSLVVDPDSSFEATQNKIFECAQFSSKAFTDLENKSKGIMDEKEEAAKKKKMPKPYLLSKEPKDPRLIKFEDVNPVEIARQFTLVEFSMFAKVTNEELLGLGWMKDSKEWTAPNITEIISRSNLMTDWVSTMILQQESHKDRVKILKHFVQVADACYKLNNFNTLFEITMGLVTNPVYRLKQTWDGIGSSERQRFKKLEDICSFQGNRKNYREELKKVPASQSCLPYLGVSLTDLVFFEEGNKSTKNTTEKQANTPKEAASQEITEKEDETVRSYINFTKRSLMAGVVSQLMEYKSRPYELHPVEYLQQFLYFSLNSNVISSEDEQDRLSRIREPPQRK